MARRKSSKSPGFSFTPKRKRCFEVSPWRRSRDLKQRSVNWIRKSPIQAKKSLNCWNSYKTSGNSKAMEKQENGRQNELWNRNKQLRSSPNKIRARHQRSPSFSMISKNRRLSLELKPSLVPKSKHIVTEPSAVNDTSDLEDGEISSQHDENSGNEDEKFLAETKQRDLDGKAGKAKAEIVGERVATPVVPKSSTSSKFKSFGASSPWIRTPGNDGRSLRRQSSNFQTGRKSIDRAKQFMMNGLNLKKTMKKMIKANEKKQKRKRKQRHQRKTALSNAEIEDSKVDLLNFNAGIVTRKQEPGTLRPIIIDGSNVAFGHSNNTVFSCKGIKIVVKFFKKRNHKEIYVFVPWFRLQRRKSVDTYILNKLYKKGVLKFTPCREVGGKRITSYDDKYIVQTAALKGGIIVSNDNFRDLWEEKPEWRETIENRVLQFTWLNQKDVLFPQDPLARKEPNLEDFLRFP